MNASNSKVSAWKAALILCASAILVWFGNGLDPYWPLMWLAPFPLLWLSLRDTWPRTALIAFSAWLLGSVNLLAYFRLQGAPIWVWFADYAGTAALVAGGILLFRYLVLRGAIWSGIAALPALSVTSDWLRYWYTPHGTAADLADTQLKFLPFLQLASVTGPWGITFLLLLVPGAAAAFLFLRSHPTPRASRVAFIVGGIIAAALIFGAVRLNLHRQQSFVKVGLIASDTPENDDTANAGADSEHLLNAYAGQITLLAAQGARVVVLPEKIVTVHNTDVASARILQRQATTTGVTIVLGELYRDSVQGHVVSFNRAVIYSPDGSQSTYDKEHLLPPFENGLTPGTSASIQHHTDTTWGFAICKDMDFTSIGRRYGQLQTGSLLVPAWDFNLDRVWHGHIAIMRGVEGGFGVVRAAKNGNLMVTDNRGRVLAEAQTDSAPFATLIATVPTDHEPTLFDAWGDWFAWVAAAILVGIFIKTLLLAMRGWKSTQATRGEA